MKRSSIFIILLSLLVVSSVGCSFSRGSVSDQTPVAENEPTHARAVKQPVTSASREGMADPSDATGKDNSTNQETTGASSSSIHKADIPHGDPDTLILLGISLGEKRSEIVDRIGQANDIYETDSEEVTQIQEYSGFSIGYSPDGKVSWVSVISEEIDPRLNGIRIGSTRDQLIEGWGKPNQENEYQIRYEKKNTVLKLDIDPSSQTIQSISLYYK
jgi:hypothetical protein